MYIRDFNKTLQPGTTGLQSEIQDGITSKCLFSGLNIIWDAGNFREVVRREIGFY